MKEDLLSDQLGFYFCVLYPNPSKDNARIWFDGNPDYQTFRQEEFLNLLPWEIRIPFRRIFRETSFFFWAVNESRLFRLSPGKAHESITSELKQKDIMRKVRAERSIKEDSIAEKYHKIDMNFLDV